MWGLQFDIYDTMNADSMNKQYLIDLFKLANDKNPVLILLTLSTVSHASSAVVMFLFKKSCNNLKI